MQGWPVFRLLWSRPRALRPPSRRVSPPEWRLCPLRSRPFAVPRLFGLRPPLLWVVRACVWGLPPQSPPARRALLLRPRLPRVLSPQFGVWRRVHRVRCRSVRCRRPAWRSRHGRAVPQRCGVFWEQSPQSRPSFRLVDLKCRKRAALLRRCSCWASSIQRRWP